MYGLVDMVAQGNNYNCNYPIVTAYTYSVIRRMRRHLELIYNCKMEFKKFFILLNHRDSNKIYFIFPTDYLVIFPDKDITVVSADLLEKLYCKVDQ
jgi:hypothetical protein